MTEPLPPFTVKEAADRLRLSEYTVGQMTRDGRLPRLPGVRRTRIPAWAVFAMMEGRYDARRGQSDGEAPAQAQSSRRRVRMQADRPLASQAVGSSDSLHRPIRAAEGDVGLSIVKVRGR